MKTKLFQWIEYWKRIFLILFTFKKKIYIIDHPIHANLGDQAQLMCTLNWLEKNYPQHKIILLGIFVPTINFGPLHWLLLNTISSMLTLAIMKFKLKKDDLFIGHSGYFFVDHHSGYKTFIDIIHYFPNNKLIILPQTINFYTPLVKAYVSKEFSKAKNVTLLCRDQVSFQNAKDMFPSVKLLLYPDIVTSLIGTLKFENKRDGVLFCLRNDLEAFYTPVQINTLINKFGNIRKEKIDTTLQDISNKTVAKYRDKFIYNTIEKIASYKVVITDRYHGTIFSAIASTPVIVISSADHKLSSGVNWFPQDLFKGFIYYAHNLDEAYNIAQEILCRKDNNHCNPPYFKENYWDKLIELL